MPATVSTVRNVVTEVLTESTTAEIAVAAIVVAAALFAFGSIYRASSVRSTALRTCGLVLALVTLSIQVYGSGWLTSFDGPVTDWMVDHRSGALNQIAVASQISVARSPPRCSGSPAECSSHGERVRSFRA